jgi:2-amino-4-hydroxy-6-hydroxymethyldihydropteridine diphosphokinase
VNKVYLSLGSNLGDKEMNLEKTMFHLQEKLGEIIVQSSLFYSKAFEFQSESDFVNNVILIQTNYDAFEILKITQEIEKEIGRKLKSTDKNYQDRIIDIDILYYNDEIIDEKDLKIPHPEILKRNFVYEPLLQIDEKFIDPEKKIMVRELIINNNYTSVR